MVCLVRYVSTYNSISTLSNAMFDFNANLSGLDEIKQFSMKEESTFHLPSKTFNEMYSFDKPLGMHAHEIVDRRSNCINKTINQMVTLLIFSFCKELFFLMVICGRSRESLP